MTSLIKKIHVDSNSSSNLLSMVKMMIKKNTTVRKKDKQLLKKKCSESVRPRSGSKQRRIRPIKLR